MCMMLSIPRPCHACPQVAEGLAEAGPQLMQSLLGMEVVMLLGVYSRIHVLQEFCAIAAVSLLCEFVFELTFYVSCLSLDIRYVELSDFTQPWFQAPGNTRIHIAFSVCTTSVCLCGTWSIRFRKADRGVPFAISTQCHAHSHALLGVTFIGLEISDPGHTHAFRVHMYRFACGRRTWDSGT